MSQKIPRRTKKDSAYYLRVFRAERDLTQAQAAELFGVGSSHWSLLEEGKRFASKSVAAALAKATGAPIEVFLGIEVTR